MNWVKLLVPDEATRKNKLVLVNLDNVTFMTVTEVPDGTEITFVNGQKENVRCKLEAIEELIVWLNKKGSEQERWRDGV